MCGPLDDPTHPDRTSLITDPWTPDPDEPTVTTYLDAGYTVGEAEDIVDHDDGDHDDDPQLGCPRCTALMED